MECSNIFSSVPNEIVEQILSFIAADPETFNQQSQFGLVDKYSCNIIKINNNLFKPKIQGQR